VSERCEGEAGRGSVRACVTTPERGNEMKAWKKAERVRFGSWLYFFYRGGEFIYPERSPA